MNPLNPETETPTPRGIETIKNPVELCNAVRNSENSARALVGPAGFLTSGPNRVPLSFIFLKGLKLNKNASKHKYVCMHTDIYIYIHTYIHTYIYIYTRTCVSFMYLLTEKASTEPGGWHRQEQLWLQQAFGSLEAPEDPVACGLGLFERYVKGIPM